MAWKKVGAILKGDKGKYIKISENVTFEKGQTLQIFDPRKSKFMTEERLATLPDYVVADIFLAPPKGGEPPAES
jgi:hypothetical protein